MPQISLKGLAKFIIASPRSQRKVLRDFKYPDPEGWAQAGYYREARSAIVAYHQQGHDPQGLLEEAARLSAEAQGAPRKQIQTRLLSNSRAIDRYHRHFAARRLELRDPLRLKLEVQGVEVTVSPDLFALEKGRDRVIFLDYSKDAHPRNFHQVISQCILEATDQGGFEIPSSGIRSFSLADGQEYKGARRGSRLAGEIESACANIAAIWETL